MGKNILLFLLIITVAGCATIPPVQQEIQSEEIIPAPYDALWQPVHDFFASGITSVESADRESGTIKTNEFTVPYEGFKYRSKYVDCGELAGLTVYRKMTGRYEVYMSELESEKTLVKLNANYRASLYSGNEFKGWVSCQSRGYLEKVLFDDLRGNISKYKKAAPQKQIAEVETPQEIKTPPPPVQVVSECIHILPSFRDDLFRKIAENRSE